MSNNILPEEQKGCQKGMYDCKAQLLVNRAMLETFAKATIRRGKLIKTVNISFDADT